MNKELRIQKITEVLEGEPVGKEQIVWKGKLKTMPVHDVPLDILIYNKYNGRILSRTKTLEYQGKEVNPETEEGKETIEKLLWDSKEDRNARTKADLEKYGQKRVGMITRDGLIIDGNRRAMLLNKIGKYDYFRAIILDVTSDQDSIEIEKLETSYQLGEDEKLDYNPIEIYLKTMVLYKRLSGKDSFDENKKDLKAIKKIYEWMGDYKSDKKEKGVEFRLKVMNTMDDYLDNFEYNGAYTQLDSREEQFRGLTRWLQDYYGKGSGKAFGGYTNGDVDDLKSIAFDYIRVQYKNTDFRYIAGGKTSKDHFFGNREIWESFRKRHFEIVEPIRDKEEKINLDSENLKASLDARDDKFGSIIQDQLQENLENHYTQLRYKKAEDEPGKLVGDAIKAVSAINKRSKFFGKAEVLNQIQHLNQITTGMLQEKSPKRILEQVLDLLTSIDIENISEDKDEILEYAKNIGKEAYRMQKDIKHLK